MAEGKAHGGAFHIPAGEGESVWVVGERVTFKATSQDTGGAFSLTEEMWPPQVGPPPHIHHTQDETFYVLEGEMEFVTEGRTTIRAMAGSFVHIPKGVLRAYKNVGNGPARAIVLFTPGGFEGFFEEMGEPVTDPSMPPEGEPEVERLVATAAKYGCEIPPPKQKAKRKESREIIIGPRPFFLPFIHRSAWKANSPKFVGTEL